MFFFYISESSVFIFLQMVYRNQYLTVPVVATDIETLASLSGFDFCDWSRSS